MSDNISREDAINVVVEYDVEQLPDKDGIHQAKAIITKATLCQEENAHSGEVTEMVDLISRQDAIEAVCGDCTIERKDKCKTDGYCYEVKNLMALPSAEAEWIPVSERLPEKDELVLVTVWNDVSIAWRNIYGGWESAEDMYEKGDVTAWMPLPKPYREEKQNG